MLALSPACFLMGCGRSVPSVRPISTAPIQTPSDGVSTTSPIANIFIEPERFAATAKLESWDYDGQPIAGVVNHHSLAMDLIAQFFKTLKSARPEIKTFIILSPDHFAQGRDISTSRLSYSTPGGLLKVDGRISSPKANAPRAQNIEFRISNMTGSSSSSFQPSIFPPFPVWDGTASRAFEKEHGVGALVPFIKREFPDAEIVPVFLSHDAPRERLLVLGRALASFADDTTFVVLSSDMSHYQRREDTVVRDRETMQWLAYGDWTRLESATDKNSDSSAGFTVLYKYLSVLKAKKDFRLMSHANSYDYTHDPANVTSYIVGFWE